MAVDGVRVGRPGRDEDEPAAAQGLVEATALQGDVRDAGAGEPVDAAGRGVPEPEARDLADQVVAGGASQILGMALTRYVLRFPPTVALTREEIVKWLGPTVQRYLTAPYPTPYP